MFVSAALTFDGSSTTMKRSLGLGLLLAGAAVGQQVSNPSFESDAVARYTCT